MDVDIGRDELLSDFGVTTLSDLLKKWEPQVNHLSFSSLTSFRRCPLNYFIERHTTMSNIGNPWLTAGVTLHKILEDFYANIKVPLPYRWGIYDSDGNVQLERKLDLKDKKTIGEYFHIVLRLIERHNTLKRVLDYGVGGSWKQNTIQDLYNDGISSLKIFAYEEAIRYLQSFKGNFLPSHTEMDLKFYFDGVPVPTVGKIDVVFQDSATKNIIAKDYKNRSIFELKPTDKLQAYIYSYGMLENYDMAVEVFKFKNIRAKHSMGISKGLEANYYPLMPEHTVQIDQSNFRKIEGLVKSTYEQIIDKNSYNVHQLKSKCPEQRGYWNNCPYSEFCLGCGMVTDDVIELSDKRHYREEYATDISNEMFTDGEAE